LLKSIFIGVIMDELDRKLAEAWALIESQAAETEEELLDEEGDGGGDGGSTGGCGNNDQVGLARCGAIRYQDCPKGYKLNKHGQCVKE
jgi:hypothetical protein